VTRAARYVVLASEAVRDARNGSGHPGEPHNRDLHFATGGPVEVFDISGDCSACGGAEYGWDDVLNAAMGDLREALGMNRRPWEVNTVARETRVTLDEMATARGWTHPKASTA
jgi:hypothetical protein